MDVATRETCSAPKRLTAAKATAKSATARMVYTPSAYQPYDFMRCFSLCERDAFGGGPGGGDRRDGDPRRAGVVWKRRVGVLPLRSEVGESWLVRGRRGLDTRGMMALTTGMRKMIFLTMGYLKLEGRDEGEWNGFEEMSCWIGREIWGAEKPCHQRLRLAVWNVAVIGYRVQVFRVIDRLVEI